MSAPGDDTPVPSTGRLAWLLFMQPLKLHRLFEAWNFRRDPSAWSLRQRLLAADLTARQVVGKLLLMLFVLTPLGALIINIGFTPWLDIEWFWTLFGMGFGVAFGVALGVAFGMAFGMVFGIVFGIVFGMAFGVAEAVGGSGYTVISFGVALGIAFGMAIGMARGVANGVAKGLATDLATGLAEGGGVGIVFVVALSVASGVADGVAKGVAFGAATSVEWGVGLGVGGGAVAVLMVIMVAPIFLRLPFFFIEALWTLVLSRLVGISFEPGKIARYLPYRHHDIVLFPLPGLEQFLSDVGDSCPELARELIDEAAVTLAQARPARRAFFRLQAGALKRAAKDKDWSSVKALNGHFYPPLAELPEHDLLHHFIDMAIDFEAMKSGGSQRHRKTLLDSAARHLDGFKKRYLEAREHDERDRLLYGAADAWSQVLADAHEALAREIEGDPEIPDVFLDGDPLHPDKIDALELFRARPDLTTIIERDLDDEQRGPLFLVGQRRMGKTSLLNMLPRYLGTATTLVKFDFQELSGRSDGHAPHRWIVEELASALARVEGLKLPRPSVTDAWGSALDWLVAVDAKLQGIDHRVLIAIDEVEYIQDGAKGRCNLTFLDFVRTSGHRLQRIRMLLACGYPLTSASLPGWAGRLISARPQVLGPLEPADAEMLLRRPIAAFPPEVFDDATSAAILAQTGRHPFLIQAVGKRIVRRLLRDRRRTATLDDVARVLDDTVAFAGSHVFAAVWEGLDPAEQTILSALAHGEPVDSTAAPFCGLRTHWYVDLRDGVPVLTFPLFGRWIRQNHSYQAKTLC